MKIKFENQEKWLRFSIVEKGGWTPTTFFPQLDSAVEKIKLEMEKNTPKHVLFDLSTLKSLDSSIISLVIQTIRLGQRRKVNIIASHEDVLNMLQLLGIDELAYVYSSESLIDEDI
jgi:STAS domain.